MKEIICFFIILFIEITQIQAQELFISTEPASNMPSHSIGFRLTNEGMFQSEFKTRTNAEIMAGISKNLMLHTGAYASNFYQPQQRFEGFSFYGKYRFLTVDSTHRHFRGALFARYSTSNNPLISQEINLEGDNTGLQGGIIFTQLLHKLALSASGSFTQAFNNRQNNWLYDQSRQSLGYTLSGGYLLFPKTYTNYRQTNVNLYFELLGKHNLRSNQNLLDAAPGIQFIFNSTLRLDLSQRFQLFNNMSRTAKNMYLIRLEYNLFNAF